MGQETTCAGDVFDYSDEDMSVQELHEELTFQVCDYLDVETQVEEMRRQSADATRVLKVLTEPDTVIRPLFEVADRLDNCLLSLQISGYQPGMVEWDHTQAQVTSLEQEKNRYI